MLARQLSLRTALMAGLPLEMFKKQCGPVSAAVVCGHKYRCSSFNHLKLAGKLFSVVVPYRGGIL